jgi:hypothetical protein
MTVMSVHLNVVNVVNVVDVNNRMMRYVNNVD